jgi:uncharacterized protein (UPF0335 family)
VSDSAATSVVTSREFTTKAINQLLEARELDESKRTECCAELGSVVATSFT